MIPQPLIEPVPDMGMVRLMADYPHKYGLVPSWFAVNGASIPPFAWPLIYTPFHPIVLGPSVPHDWLYLTHAVSRAEADLLFYEMLLENGADPIRAQNMYTAVRIAGRYFWTQTQADLDRLAYMYGFCRGRAEFDAYGFPEMAA